MNLSAGQIWSEHIDSESVPWVGDGRGGKSRILQAKLDDKIIIHERIYEPGCEFALHRHKNHVMAFTYEGAWGHRPREFTYRRGTYVYEPVDVVHSFHNGPQETHCMFVVLGDVEVFAPDGKRITDVFTTDRMFTDYMEACERAGLERPNILR